jgi:predicted acetyltransferase
MITRILKPEERYRAALTIATAYERPLDFEKEKEACLSLTQVQKDNILHPNNAQEAALPSEVIQSPKFWATLTDDEETLFSCLDISTYTVRFGGKQVLMGGVGLVASLPHYRRMGGVRACMKAALEDMYDNGYIFSSLYPFSTTYYRQFGYEKGMPVHTWTLPLENIRATDVGGRVRQLLPGDSLEPLAKVYNCFYNEYNLSVVRRVYDQTLDVEALLKQLRYIYLWENEAGDPRGFMITHKDGDVLDCTNTFNLNNGMIFLDRLAFQGLFSFVRSAFSSFYQAIRFCTPACQPMDALLVEGNSTTCERTWNGMVRVVNVEHALSLCRCKGEGSLIVDIIDPMLPGNQGPWRISFAPGRPNQVEKTGYSPDITLPISDFSALLCGIWSGQDLCWMPDVQVHSPCAPFEQVFYPQKCHTLDLF